MSTKLKPSPPLEPVTAIQKRLEKEKNDVKGFIFSVENIKKTITYFGFENEKSEKKKNTKPFLCF